MKIKQTIGNKKAMPDASLLLFKNMQLAVSLRPYSFASLDYSSFAKLYFVREGDVIIIQKLLQLFFY